MIESLLSISQFEKLMNSKLNESFGECIRDFRGEKYCVSEQIIKESKKDKRTTKIFLIYEGNTIFSKRNKRVPIRGQSILCSLKG